MTENQEHKESIRDIFPSGGQTVKIAALSIAMTFLGFIILGLVEICFFSPIRTERSVYDEAHKIISNLKTIRAVLMASAYWYADYADGIEVKADSQGSANLDNLAVRFRHSADKAEKDEKYKYKAQKIEFSYFINLAHDAAHAKPGDYIIEVLNDGKTLYAGYKLGRYYHEEALRKRLTVDARSNGLLGKGGKNTYHRDDEVYLSVMDLSPGLQ